MINSFLQQQTSDRQLSVELNTLPHPPKGRSGSSRPADAVPLVTRGPFHYQRGLNSVLGILSQTCQGGFGLEMGLKPFISETAALC